MLVVSIRNQRKINMNLAKNPFVNKYHYFFQENETNAQITKINVKIWSYFEEIF